MELYIHIPFCIQKCKYCDFLSAPANTEAQNTYMQALCQEITGRSEAYKGRKVTSVFIGGGTPTAVAPAWIVKIMELIKKYYDVSETAEISMEVNPGTVDKAALDQYKVSGINRLSIGLQSANDEELKRIGRIHDYIMFEKCYYTARGVGFENINVDLMCALPGQTFDSFQKTLETVTHLSPAPEHISVYSLILEEGTPLYEEYETTELNLPDEDTERLMYEHTGKYLLDYGYARYEISNYAKKDYECQHNIGYWEREDYLGFGIGAASKIGNKRFSNTRNIEKYQSNPCDSYEEVQELSTQEVVEETMFLGLRMIKGVSLSKFKSLFGVSMQEVYGPVIQKHTNNGLLCLHEDEEGKYLRLTQRGLDVSNYVMSDFLEPGLFSF